VVGAIQVPAGGEPIVLMPDGPVTGGYPKIATVIRADLPVLGQWRPGQAVRFREVTLAAAIAAWKESEETWRERGAAARSI
jgi:allophanate hydrolase subunit 2